MKPTRWTNQQKPTRYYSNKQEKTIAKQINGKQTANSGATLFSKGDVKSAYFLIEAKTVTKEQKTFTIKREWIDKNREEAFAMGKPYSAIAIDFGDGEQHYLIDEKLFVTMLKLIEEGF